MKTTISIVTVTYNAGVVLPALIKCLLAQTDKNFQWVVVDGGSTDNTLELLRSLDSLNVTMISEPDFGIYDAMNKGVRLASGAYYLVIGADDILYPGAVAKYRDAVSRAKAAPIIVASVVMSGKVVHPFKRLDFIRSAPPVVASHSVGTLIAVSLHSRYGFYSNRYPIASDIDFLSRLRRHQVEFAQGEFVAGEFTTDGTSGADTLGALVESYRARVENNGHYLIQSFLLFARLARHSRRIIKQIRNRRARDEASVLERLRMNKTEPTS